MKVTQNRHSDLRQISDAVICGVYTETKMKSSLFNLPIGLGTWVGVYLPCGLYVLFFTKALPTGDPEEYERDVRGRK